MDKTIMDRSRNITQRIKATPAACFILAACLILMCCPVSLTLPASLVSMASPTALTSPALQDGPGLFGITAYAAEGQNLVIEVVEEIPADRMVKHKNGMVEPMAGSSGSADGAVEIEDSEVPLAAGPAERAFPVIPVIYLGAAVIAFAGYELIGHRRRNALFKIRRDGYREEARRQREKEAAR